MFIDSLSVILLFVNLDLALGSDDVADYCNQTMSTGLIKIVTPEATNQTVGRPFYCHYKFQSSTEPQGTFWRLIFHRFAVSEPERNCTDGFVRIIDGGDSSPDSSSLGRICGNFEQKHEYISENPNVTVIFFAERYDRRHFVEFVAKDEPKWNLYQRFGQYPQLNPNRRGHHVGGTYCDRVFPEDECSNGWCHVQSPGFPGFYLPNLTCHYLIHVKETFAKLTLASIDVDSMRCDSVECFPRILTMGDECDDDFVRIYDGPSTSSPSIATMCGRSKSKIEMVASSSIMLVEFATADVGTLTNYGFEFRATGMSGKREDSGRLSESCDVSHRLFDTRRVYVRSIKHWYPANTTCRYRVTALDHEILEVTFKSFRADKESSYCTNYLMVYDGFDPDPTKVIVQLCDMNPPRSKILTTGPNVLIVYHSERGSLDGEALTYVLDVRSHDARQFGYSLPGTLCDETFSIMDDTSGNFSSPRNFLKFQTADSLVSCRYQFQASSRRYHRTSMTFFGMFDEQSPDCSLCYGLSTGYIRAYEDEDMISCICGIAETGPKKFTVTSDGPTLTLIYTFTPRLIKQFPSHFGRAQVMFEGYYELFHGPRCGPIEYPSTLDGFIQYPSPRDYQGPYFQKTLCIWKVKREANKDLFIKIADFYLHSVCASDYLEIRSSKSPADFKWRLCGNSSRNVYQKIVLRQQIVDSSIEIEMASSRRGNTFNITWTQVDYHERSIYPEALVQDCAFRCHENDNILCLDRSLVCNGINNCPTVTTSDSSTIAFTDDEASCGENVVVWDHWISVGLGCGLAFCVFLLSVVVYFRHCRNPKFKPIKQVYHQNGECSTYTIS
ncbi:Uncharacterised protein g10337 [Pycnogonum litorale]